MIAIDLYSAETILTLNPVLREPRFSKAITEFLIALRLVFGGRLNVLDGKSFDLTHNGFQLEAKLIF
jgi:hypothetical protein